MSGISAFKRDLRKLPNLITLSRIVLVCVALYLYFRVDARVGLVVGTIAGLTDLVDGMVARATGQVSRLGEVLDQFSDLVFETWVLFLVAGQTPGYPQALVLVYLLREFWVVTLRRFMAEYHINIASNFLGKLKTNFLMYSCIPSFGAFAGIWGPLNEFAWYLGLYGMCFGILCGYIAAWDYTRQFIRGYDEVCR